jgi:hypothetical protein
MDKIEVIGVDQSLLSQKRKSSPIAPALFVLSLRLAMLGLGIEQIIMEVLNL